MIGWLAVCAILFLVLLVLAVRWALAERAERQAEGDRLRREVQIRDALVLARDQVIEGMKRALTDYEAQIERIEAAHAAVRVELRDEARRLQDGTATPDGLQDTWRATFIDGAGL